MKPAFWFMPVAMVTLARHLSRTPRAFTASELLAWAPELGKPSTTRYACLTLQHRGILQIAPSVAPSGGRKPTNPQTWQLTPDGMLACKAALHETAKLSRSATLKARNLERALAGTLYLRLWSLLRIRKALTAPEAVGLLADAGDDMAAKLRSVRNYLHRWYRARPDAIQISARRVDSYQRYVLVQDIGPMPPLAPIKKKQEAAAQ
ncbi:MAG: hypothetical protein PHU77_00585 [Simplicispira sp.]|nr:hypothetical protein [Simplicispira sp.]